MSKFKRLVVKENEMLVSISSRGNRNPIYVKVLLDEAVYDKNGNEVGELFFSKTKKGEDTIGYFFKKDKPTIEYIPNDKRLRKELGID